MEKSYALDITEKKIFIILKPTHFKKINNLNYSVFMSVPNKTKIGGNQMELNNLWDYNFSEFKINKKCSGCG